MTYCFNNMCTIGGIRRILTEELLGVGDNKVVKNTSKVFAYVDTIKLE